jgi:vacuole morphology and inheritance protein 14
LLIFFSFYLSNI